MSPKPLNLLLNPSARISVSDTESPPSFLIEAPIKGASLSSVLVSAGNLPGAHAFLRSVLIDGKQDAQIDEQTASELQRIGMFAPADALPQAVVYRIPQRAPDSIRPSLQRSRVDDLPGRPALCVPAEWSNFELRFEPHHHASVWAPVQVAAGAGIEDIHDKRQPEPEQPQTTLDDEATHGHFEREGWAILENLLPDEHLTEMGRYFQALAEQGFLSCCTDDGIRRYIAHNHPVARFWHHQLNERVSQLAGRRTRPSYAFASLYLAGGDLFWHTDRPPCEYTIALLLDYAPLDANGRSAWSLKLKGRDGTLQLVHQRIGEALVFKGRELMHGRDMLPDGHRSASLLFHFVNEDYEGELD